MTKGVDIIIGDITLKNQSSASGATAASYGQDSLASGVYHAVESYDNDITDVEKLEAFQVGANKIGVIILHE